MRFGSLLRPGSLPRVLPPTALVVHTATFTLILQLGADRSIAWFAGAALSHDWALGTQNMVLFAINLLGVYRYLIRKKPNG